MELRCCWVDLVRGRVVRDDQDVVLTTREADLLRYFAAHPSRVIPRDELLEQVWGYSDTVLTRASDNSIRRLRTKVEADPARPDHILTVHGAGYRFEPQGSVVPAREPVEAPAWQRLGPGLEVDLPRRRVRRGGAEVDLTEPEAVVLGALLRAPGVVERDALRDKRARWRRSRWEGRGTRSLGLGSRPSCSPPTGSTSPATRSPCRSGRPTTRSSRRSGSGASMSA